MDNDKRWNLFFGISQLDAKQVVSRTAHPDLHGFRSVALLGTRSVLRAGDATPILMETGADEEYGAVSHRLALLFEVDLLQQTMAVQSLRAPHSASDVAGPSTVAVLAEAKGAVPEGWVASAVVTTAASHLKLDLTQCLPLLSLFGRVRVSEIEAPAKWWPPSK